MKLLVFLAKGFETIEFSGFIDVMGWAKTDFGCDVEVVTGGFNEKVISSFNIPVLVDKTIDEISVDEYDALAIPGGFEVFGFYEEAYEEKLLNLIRQFDARKKWIATVCVGALPVGKSGVLKDRKATTYHLGGAVKQKVLQSFGAIIVNEPIVVGDKICNFITYWFTVTYNVYQRAVLNLVSFWYHYITFVIISLNFISYIFLLYF